VVISGGVGALQLAGMAALYAAGRLTAASSFAVMGASSLAGGGVWLIFNRRQIQLRGAAVRASFQQNWGIGGWSVGTQLSEIAAQHMFPLLLTVAMSKSAAGVYAACAMIASLLLPLQNAASNVLVPELVHARAQGGVEAVRRVVRTAAGAMSAVMGMFCLGVAAVSSSVLFWVYGDEFAGVSGTAAAIVALAVGQFLAGASLPAARALVALERPQAVFASQLAAIVANFCLGVPLIAGWGIAGAAYASLAGMAVRAAIIWWRYLECARLTDARCLGCAPAAMELAAEGAS
jgi:O-antigen/teichoic acid export membrane protein